MHLWTTECVSNGHPDKVADQISDAILDAYLSVDPDSKVAVETLITANFVVVAGEVHSDANPDIEQLVRKTIWDIGYTSEDDGIDPLNCQFLNKIHTQSHEIRNAVVGKELGAGDQGIMFGFATKDTPSYMPLGMYLARQIINNLLTLREELHLLPDAKSQVTLKYEGNKIVAVDTVVVSTQHKSEVDIHYLRQVLQEKVINHEEFPSLFENTKYIINPAGAWTYGGPKADTGLTGRKIVVDQYGPDCPIGGGAFSGKDPTKVDRSAAYAARHLAKQMIASGHGDIVCVQLSYAIGLSQPVSIHVKIDGKDADLQITSDFSPQGIIERFDLKRPIYLETATKGHFGPSHYAWEQVD